MLLFLRFLVAMSAIKINLIVVEEKWKRVYQRRIDSVSRYTLQMHVSLG